MYLCTKQSSWYTFELLSGILSRYHLQLKEEGICPLTLQSCKLHVSLKDVPDAIKYDFQTLSVEVYQWAQQEIGIIPKIIISQEENAGTYDFHFTVTIDEIG